MKANDLEVVERYDVFFNYIYQKLQSIPRNHGILKDRAITLVLIQPELLYKAVQVELKLKL